MKMKRSLWVVTCLLLWASVALGQQKWVPYIENPNWRPAASELLETVTGDRYDVHHVLNLKPESFDPQRIEQYLTQVEKNKFQDVNEEFECKYTMFRYALARWTLSTDDPSVDSSFKRRYIDFQAVCRRLDREHAFVDAEQEEKAEWVKDPFDVYRYFLMAYLDEEALQLDTRENPVRPFTLAEDYIDYPSEMNTRQLKDAFFLINRYFESGNYTWNRYIHQRKFEVARQKLYAGEWERERKRYEELLRHPRGSAGYRMALKEIRDGANFTYQRLRKEGETNCLPYFSEVNALYLSHSLDDYFKKVELARMIGESRKATGMKKEVVIFIHGLGQDRTCCVMCMLTSRGSAPSR